MSTLITNLPYQCDVIYDSTFWVVVNANATLGTSDKWDASFYYNHVSSTRSTYSIILSTDVVDIKSAFRNLTGSSLIEFLPAELLTYDDVSIMVEMSKTSSFSVDAVRVKAELPYNITIIPNALYLDALYADIGLRQANGTWGIATTFQAVLGGSAFTNSIVSVVASFTHLPITSTLQMRVAFPAEPLTLAEVVNTIGSSLSLGVLPAGLGTDILNAIGLDYLFVSYSGAKPGSTTASGFQRFDIGLTVAGSSAKIGTVPISFTDLVVNVGCSFAVAGQKEVDFSFTGGATIGTSSFEVKIVRPAGNTAKPTATLKASGLKIGKFLELIVDGFDPSRTKATGSSELLPVEVEIDFIQLIWSASGDSITDVKVHFSSKLPDALANLGLSNLLAKTVIDYNVADKSLHLQAEFDVTVGGVDFDINADVFGTSGSFDGTEITPTQVLTLAGIADSIKSGASATVKSKTGIDLSVIALSNAELNFRYAPSVVQLGFSGQVANLGGIVRHPVNVTALAGRDGGAYFALGVTTSFGTVGDIIADVTHDNNFPGVDFIEAFQSSSLGVVIAVGTASTKPGFGFSINGLQNTAHNFPVAEGLNLLASVQPPNCGNITTASVSGIACLIASVAFAESGLTAIDVMVNIGEKGLNTYASAPTNGNRGFGLSSIASGIKSSSKSLDFQLKGFAVSEDGNLRYPGTILQPWTGMGTNGYGAINPSPVGIEGTGNVLLNLYLQYNRVPDCPGCDLSANIDIFVGVHSTGISTGLINIKDITFGVLGEPIAKLASAYGLFRLDETHSTDNDTGLEIILLDKIRSYISIPTMSPKTSVDAFFLFRPEDSLNALGMKYQQKFSFLGFEIAETEIDFQYIGSNEVNRRRNYRGAGCKCTADGRYCKEQSALDRYVIENSLSGDSWIILHASVNLNWYIVTIDDAELLLIADVKDSASFASTFKLTLDAHVTVLFIAKASCIILVDSHEASFSASADVELATLTVSAKAEVVDSGPGIPVTLGNTTTPIQTSSLMRTMDWDLHISFDLNPYIKAGIAFVSHLAVEAAEEALKAVDVIASGVLEKLHADGLLGEIPDYWNHIKDEIKGFEKSIGLPDGFNNLVPGLNLFLGDLEVPVPGPVNAAAKLFSAYEAFKNGDDVAGVGDLLGAIPVIGQLTGLLFHTDVITEPSGNLDSYGCMKRNYVRIFPFSHIILIGEGPNTDCLKQLAALIKQVGTTLNYTHTISTSVQASLNQTPVLSVIQQQGANYTAPLPTYGNVTVTKMANQSTSHLASVAPTAPLNVVKLVNGPASNSTNGTVVINRRDPTASGAYLPASPLDFTFPSVNLTADLSTINATLAASLPSFYSALSAHFLNGEINAAHGIEQLASNLGKAITPPVLVAPQPMTVTCRNTLKDFVSFIRNSSNGHVPVISYIDSQCNGPAQYFSSSPFIDGGHPADCQAQLYYSWTLVDSCGQQSNTVQLPILVDELPPLFNDTAGALDITVSCDSSINPNITGTPTPQGGCGIASLNLTYVDTRVPTPNVCGGITIVRNWTVAQDNCSKTGNYIQNIYVVDKVPPKFATFPSNASTDLFKPVGSDIYGYPTAYDTCGNAPVSVTSVDSYSYSQACAADKVLTRTWTATDACGNHQSQNQTISIVNSDHRVLDASVGGTYSFSDTTVVKSVVMGQVVAGGDVDITFSSIGNGTCSVTPFDVNAIFAVSAYRSSVRLNMTATAPSPYRQNVTLTYESARQFSQLIAQNFGTTLLRGPQTINCTSGTKDGAVFVPASVDGLVNAAGNCTVLRTASVNATGAVTFTGPVGNKVAEMIMSGTHPLYNFFDMTWQLNHALESQWRYGFTFNVPSGSLVFINNNASFSADDLSLTHVNLNGLSPSSILWNFPYLEYFTNEDDILTHNLIFNNSAWPGSILAPHALVSSSNAALSGQIIGRRVELYDSLVD
ncbi:hypothetical protein HK101_006546, partial [Irineochytrium annulatum]